MQEIIFRTDHQTLMVCTNGMAHRIKLNPNLKQTYCSIHLNDRKIFFQNLISGRRKYDRVGLAIYNAQMQTIRAMDLEQRRYAKCQIEVENLFLIAGRREMLDGRDLTNERIEISGKLLIEILEEAGYERPEYTYDLKIQPDRLYWIPPTYINNMVADLSPDNIADIVNEFDIDEETSL